MSYRLTMSQREVLEALIKLYEKQKRMVKSKEIAELINRDEGTVRNIILSLKSLGLVESKTGPTGGYMPTLKAYEVLRGAVVHVPIRLQKDGRELDLTVTSIELMDVFNPEGSKALLKAYGDFSEVQVGDIVALGPSPLARVVIEGEVTHVDPTSGQISLRILRIVAIPQIPIGKIATRNPITLTPDTSIRVAAAMFNARRIKGAPVVDSENRLVGIITQSDITRAIAEGNLNARVEDYMSKPVITIRENEDLTRAIQLMNERGIGRLIVVDDAGRMIGIVTRTDILKYIAGLA